MDQVEQIKSQKKQSKEVSKFMNEEKYKSWDGKGSRQRTSTDKEQSAFESGYDGIDWSKK